MARINSEYNEDCGCRKCSTWATIAEYTCGCVTVNVHQDTSPCDECTDFSGRRESCGQSGYPEDHD
ncbi:MAG TPA: hypothetical protein VFG10_09350 [Saprospiraceae bacterium]|nr:hypothetical protein [Saprospiraceae bacterium]